MNLQELQEIRTKVFEKSEKPFEKGGQRAMVGEVREYGGKKYVKHTDGWVYVADGKAHVFNGKITASNAKEAESHHIDHYNESVNKDKKVEVAKKDEMPKSSDDKFKESDLSVNDSFKFGESGLIYKVDKVNEDSIEYSYKNKYGQLIENEVTKELFLKKINNSSVEKIEDKPKSEVDKYFESPIPQIGDKVSITGGALSLISLSSLKGQKLTVIGEVKTGLISQPYFVKVKDEDGEEHELNPSYIEKIKEQPKVEDKPKPDLAKTYKDAGIKDMSEGGGATASERETLRKTKAKEGAESVKTGIAKRAEELGLTEKQYREKLTPKEKVGSLDKLTKIKDKIVKPEKLKGSFEKHLQESLQEGDSVKLADGSTKKVVEMSPGYSKSYVTLKDKDGSNYHHISDIVKHNHKDSGKSYTQKDFEN
jgi:hypothetical protein